MAREHVSGRRFGEVSLGVPGLVAQLRRGRSLQLRTADRLLAFMGMEPVGPAFRREVDAFLAATGLKMSLFGEMAAGDPSFVAGSAGARHRYCVGGPGPGVDGRACAGPNGSVSFGAYLFDLPGDRLQSDAASIKLAFRTRHVQVGR